MISTNSGNGDGPYFINSSSVGGASAAAYFENNGAGFSSAIQMTLNSGGLGYRNYASATSTGVLMSNNSDSTSSASNTVITNNNGSGTLLQLVSNAPHTGLIISAPSASLDRTGYWTCNGFKYVKSTSFAGDLDNLSDAGFYDGSALGNAPNTGYFHIEVFRYSVDTSWVVQRITSFGAGNTGNITYQRTKESGTWTAWRVLASTATGGTATQSVQADGSVKVLNNGSFTSGLSISPTTGTTGLTINNAVYSQVGDIVTVSIGFVINIPITPTFYTFTVNLPVARATTTQRMIGQGQVVGNITNTGAIVITDTTTTAFIAINKFQNGVETWSGNMSFQYSTST